MAKLLRQSLAYLRWFVWATLFFLWSSSGSYAQYYETAVSPLAGDQFSSARYRIWLPAGVQIVKGIIIRQHGCGTGGSSTGLYYAEDLQWQALAQKHQMALLGTELTNTALCAQWFNLEGGSDKALFRALEALAGQSGHEELKNVPWALWGHSGGGFWCTNMLFKYPERILTMIARSGGYSFLKWDERVKQIPVAWMCGENDVVDNQVYVKTMTIRSFDAYRKFGALWCLAIDPLADHGNRQGRSFYIRWMDAVLTQRLPNQGNQPQPIDSLHSWWGNLETNEIAKTGKMTSRFKKWVWLPDEPTARAWQEFIRKGWVTDLTAPPAPYHLAVKSIAKGNFQLSWQSSVDLESGLNQFNIYRNGQLIDSLPGQNFNYGDAPAPKVVNFVYRLPMHDFRATYQVSAFNHQGLESEKSKPLRVANRIKYGKSKRN